MIKSLKTSDLSKIFQNYEKIWEIMSNVQNIHLYQNPSKLVKKILKNVKNPPKFTKNPPKFLKTLKIMQNV